MTEAFVFEIRTERVAYRPVPLVPLSLFVVLEIVFHVPLRIGPWVMQLRRLFVVIFALSWIKLPRKPGAMLRVDDTWISLDGKPIIRRDQVTHAVARGGSEGKKPAVRVGVSGIGRVPLDVFLSSREDADELVSAIGGGVHQSVARFLAEERSVSVFRVFVFSVLVVAILTMIFTGRYRIFLYPVLNVIVIPVIFVMMRRQITVGRDGLFIEPRMAFMFKSTFVSFAELDAVLIKKERVSLISNGKERRFAIKEKRKKKWEYAGAATLVARIKDAQRTFDMARTNTDARIVAGLVARAGRPAAAWLAALRDLVDGPVTFDRLSVPRDRLLGVAEDPRLDGEARAGAAAALAKVSPHDEEVKDRLRAAANVTAEPALRRVLELATRPEASGLEGALDDVPESRRAEPGDLQTALDATSEASDKTTSR